LILKIFLPEKLAKIIGVFFTKNTATYAGKVIISRCFLKKFAVFFPDNTNSHVELSMYIKYCD
jgi:hypothetical protein